MFTIQFINTRTLRAQGSLAEWSTLPPQAGVNYTSAASVLRLIGELELDADGATQYRLVESDSADGVVTGEVYGLLDRLARGQLPDSELGRLQELSADLDRRAVTYRGSW